MGPTIARVCEEEGIPLRWVRQYTLRSEEDEAFFREAQVDLLLVIGWERLIPADILKMLGRFACGMHGSPFGLPRGRGRSPMNWALIEGDTRFITCLFKYSPDTDAGDIIGMKAFEITPTDDIAILHTKNRISMLQLLETYLPLIERREVVLWPQPPERPSFYPKRAPEDGVIDWEQSTEEICRLVRAVASPYPGAYCFLDGQRVAIDEVVPFDRYLFSGKLLPGAIVDIVESRGWFVVKTCDGSLLVKSYRGVDPSQLQVGVQLVGGDHLQVLEQIRERYGKEIIDEEREI